MQENVASMTQKFTRDLPAAIIYWWVALLGLASNKVHITCQARGGGCSQPVRKYMQIESQNCPQPAPCVSDFHGTQHDTVCCTCTCIFTHIGIYTHIQNIGTHAHTYTLVHTHTHTKHTYIYIYNRAHTCTHTGTHTHARTCAHTHTQS